MDRGQGGLIRLVQWFVCACACRRRRARARERRVHSDPAFYVCWINHVGKWVAVGLGFS